MVIDMLELVTRYNQFVGEHGALGSWDKEEGEL
jgi:hypothetical protein